MKLTHARRALFGPAGPQRAIPADRHRFAVLGGSLSVQRQLAGLGLVVVGLPTLTLALFALRGPHTLANNVLTFQLFVVVVAILGGIWPALLAAAGAGFALVYFFVTPIYSTSVTDPVNVVALAIFLVVAALVSFVVDRSARRSREARRSAAEADMLVSVANSVIGGEDALQALVERLREAFGMVSVVVREDGRALYSATEADALHSNDLETTVPVGRGATLDLRGRALSPSDRRVLGAFVAQIGSALTQRHLARVADQAQWQTDGSAEPDDSSARGTQLPDGPGTP